VGVKAVVLPILLAAAPVMLAADAARPRTVTMDVKDAEARDVLRSMQKQCGIKNMLVDPEVQELKGATFKFTEVPCDVAFRVVFRTFGLAGVIHPNSIVTVKPRR
jgi:hypothetical protein